MGEVYVIKENRWRCHLILERLLIFLIKQNLERVFYVQIRGACCLLDLTPVGHPFDTRTALTCVSVSFNCLESCMRLDTDRYLFLSNSASSALICAAEKAVRGRFLRSSPLLPDRPSSAYIKVRSTFPNYA